MKRQADKQLIRDEADADDSNNNDREPGTGFKMADEDALATRQIRGLPKRRVAGGSGLPMPKAPGPSTDDAPPAPKFAGFAGFGAPASTKPFTVATTAPTVTTAPTASVDPLFSTSIFSGLGASSAPAPAPARAPSTTSTGPTNAAKTFGSFLNRPTDGGSTTNGSTDATPTPIPSTAAKTEADDNKAAVDYYCGLRGLNVSLLDSAKKAFEKDAFADFSSLLENYRKYRTDIQEAFDKKDGMIETSKPAEATKPTLPTPAGSFSRFGSFGTDPPASASSSTNSVAAPIKLAGMPTPPTNFAGFGKPVAEPAKPTLAALAKPAEYSSEAAPVPPSSGFSFAGKSLFGNSNESSKPTPAVPSSTSFIFGPPPTPGPSFFGPGTSSAPSALPFSFGKPADSKSSTAPISSLPFTFNTSSTSTSSPPKEAPKSVFGDLSKAAEKKEEDKPSPSAPGITFGVPSSTSNPFGSFSTKPNAIPFSFGAPSTAPIPSEGKPDSTPPRPSFFAAPTGFSFGSGSTSTSTFSVTAKKEAEESKEIDAASAADGTPAPDSTSPFGPNPHDEEGEGEEDEVTTHSIRSKVYRLKKADEKGGAGWVEIGSGILRLKKHKENDSRRVLLRNSTTGKINLNFKIYSALKPSLAKKTVTFIGHDNGVAQTYSVRVGSEAAAAELKNALDREIEVVKSKESI